MAQLTPSRFRVGLTAFLAAACVLTLQAQRVPLAEQSSCPAAAPQGDRTYPIRKLAFDAQTAGDAKEARRLMRCAVRVDAADLTALKQLVYLDLNAGDESGAIEDIDTLRSLNASSPDFEAQEGYIYFRLHQYPQAREAFARAAATGNPVRRAQALKSIEVIDQQYPNHTLEVAVDAQYLNRFSDGVVDTYARYFERIGGKQSPFRAFANARLLRDTASKVGPLPQIFSDNAFLAGVGVAFQPHEAHYFLSAEANEAYVFYAGRNNTSALVTDIRTVAGYYNVFRPGAGSPLHRVSVQANGSVGFYSRYQHDVIAYLQPQETYDLTTGNLRISPFFQQSFAFDTNQQFYNNTAELIPGLQLSLARFQGAAFRVEYVRGYYLPFHTNSVNTYGPTYNDFRIRLVFDKLFFLRRAADPQQTAEPPAGGPH